CERLDMHLVGVVKLQDSLAIVSAMQGTPVAAQAVGCSEVEPIILANIFCRPKIDLLARILALLAAAAFENQLMLNILKEAFRNE
ncbi:MAG TPA: hypothetical protein VGC99_29585, partial [Candidatus Tectomicrobia bacterium]